MYFETAGIDVSLFVPPLTALAISFFTSMAGVSGAFLLLPFQMSVLGFTNPSVSSTNQLFNIVAIPSGVYRYLREGRMVWPLTWAVIIGTLPGVLLGAWVRVAWLPDPRQFKLFAAAVLGYIGCRMARDLLFKKSGGHDRAKGEKRPQVTAREPGGAASPGTSGGPGLPPARVIRFDAARIAYEFQGETYAVSTPGIFALSLLVGIVGGVYGIGGGSIIAPFFVSIYGLPVYTVAGAALMGTFVTSVAGVAFYQAIAPFYPHMSVAPDWGLGLLFGLGGMVGMYLGARCQRHVPARIIKGMLTAIIFFTVWKYVAEYLR
ncbi:MAG: sulfite exporter TauE/SafE family protein [Thermodesulfobacteriota bacterium]